MQHNYAVIMAGGVGSRLWPLSREKKPKQFIDILKLGNSLIQFTYKRMLAFCPQENIYIVSNVEYKDIIQKQLPDISSNQLLLEPQGRNTAPCIAFAAYKIKAKDPNANMIVAPADHLIFEEDKFTHLAKQALAYVKDNNQLLTIGIKPHRPETAYGYIQVVDTNDEINKVKTFTEKPEYNLALKFFESGEYLWNAGIFIWNVNTIISSFRKHTPDLALSFEEGNNIWFTDKETDFIYRTYEVCRKESIDYAILEKSDNVSVIVGNFRWSDLGSWESLHESLEQNEENNSFIGQTLTLNTHNSHVRTDNKKKLIIVDGLDDYLVVDEKDVLLICPKNNEKQFRVYSAKAKKINENL